MFDRDQNSIDTTNKIAKEIAGQINGFIKDGKNITVNIPPEINRGDVQSAVLAEVDSLPKQDRNLIPDKLLNDVFNKIKVSIDGKVDIPSTDLPKYSGLESINSKKESVDPQGNKPSKETTVYEKPSSKTTVPASKQAGEFQNIEESQPQSDMTDKPDRIVIRISSKKISPSKNEKTNKTASAIDATMGRGAKTGVEEKRVQESAMMLWRRGVKPETLLDAINKPSLTLKEDDKEDLLKIEKELEKLTKAFPDITKDFQQAAGKSDDCVIEKRSGEAYSYDGNEVPFEKTNRGIQVAPSEWSSPDVYDPEYIEASEGYIDDIANYTKNFDDIEIPSDYKEPDMSPPQGSSYPVNYPSSAGHETSTPRQTISSVSNAGKQMVSNAVNSAKTNAKIATRKGLQKLALAAAPIIAKILLIAAIASALAAAFLAWLASVIITILLWMAGFVAFVVIILFIINSGAYVLPQGDDLTTFGPSGGSGGTYLGEGCPSGWPTDSGYITQGSYTNNYQCTCCDENGLNCGPCNGSHWNMEAIDIGGNLMTVYATHNGTARVYRNDDCIGNYIEISSTCGNLGFFSQYAHLEAISISDGQLVQAGQEIGISDNTGGCTTGAHLHYRFQYTDLSNPSFPNNPPFMMPEYVPQTIPVGCCDSSVCGSF